MSRWTPRGLGSADRLTELQEDLDHLDEEPLEEYYQRQVSAAAAQLQRDDITDPGLRARLERDLRHWRSLVAASSIGPHWDAGEGDRPLF